MPTLPDLHQGGVHRDPVQPGRERRATVEVGEMPERAQERLLNRVLSGRAIARDACADSEERSRVRVDQMPKRGRVPGSGPRDPARFVVCHEDWDARCEVLVRCRGIVTPGPCQVLYQWPC